MNPASIVSMLAMMVPGAFTSGKSLKPVVRRSSKWEKARKAHLKKFPFCQATGLGKKLEVHHILPFHEFPELELDPDNHITLTEWTTLNVHLWFGHFGNYRLHYNPRVQIHSAIMLDAIRTSPKELGKPEYLKKVIKLLQAA